MKKRFLALFLAMLMVVSLFPVTALAAWSGTGDGTTGNPWQIGKDTPSDVTAVLDNGTLTISGTGAMMDFVNAIDTPWFVNSSITAIVVGSDITSIGVYAFCALSTVTSVNLPDGLTSIGKHAFSECNGLKSVTIPASVKSIGDNAFSECKNLELVIIPDGVETIGDYALFGNKKLKSVTLPSGLKTIGEGLFVECESLESLTIPASVESIGDYAFYASGIKSVTIPAGVKSIGEYAFYGCESLTTMAVKAKNPPTFGEAMLGDAEYPTKLTTIYVPAGAVDTYKTATGWIDYADIIKGAYFVDTEAQGKGTVTVDKDLFATDTYTEATETVTVTATPDEGYQLKSLTYKAGDNEPVDIMKDKSFTMPLANVTVTAEFEVNGVDCPVCGGTGRKSDCESCHGTLVCYVCSGTGRVDCASCEDGHSGECGNCFEGHVPCDECAGEGKILCTECGGERYFSCEFCGETGRCPDCDGYSYCIYCDQDGKCGTCGGSGKQECPECGGAEGGCAECDFTGTIDCDACEGGVCPYCNGNFKCPSCEDGSCPTCKGTAYINCTICEGEGTIACTVCLGSGSVDCPECEGSYHLDCEECHGVGSFECNGCKGTGKCLDCVCTNCGGTGKVAAPEAPTTHTHDGVTFTAINDLTGLKDLFEKGGKGYLTADITGVTEALTVAADKTVDLCLNDKVLNLGGKNITVAEGAKFNLYDCGKTVRYYDKDATTGLWTLNTVKTSDDETTTGGVITGGTDEHGGGIFNFGTLTVKGGTICGNTADAGGGICNFDTLTVKGGTICGNTSLAGGGIYNGGILTVNGGTICGNTSQAGGGIQNGGTLKLLAAEGKEITITGNTATAVAGGVGNWSEEMHLSGKVIIKDNICTNKYNTTVNYPINLATNWTITIDGALTGSEIYITHADGSYNKHNTGVLTSDYTTKNTGAKLNDFFHYDGPSAYYMVLNTEGDYVGELEVIEVPSGSYAISIPSTVGGVVTADKQIAAESETVTLTVAPDKGYQLKEGTLKVNGFTAAVRQLDAAVAGKYEFTMPEANVTVTAEFEKITHDLSVTKIVDTVETPATEGEDYAWDGNRLIILTNDLTVTGTTEKEYIWVDSTVSTLTIKDLTITSINGIDSIAFESSGTLTLKGTNVLTADGDCKAVQSGGNLSIVGDGNLTATSGNTAIFTYDLLSIGATGTIIADGTQYGLYGNHGVTIASTVTDLTVYGASSDYGAITWDTNTFTLSSGLTMTASTDYKAATITSNATVGNYKIVIGGAVAKSVKIVPKPHDLKVYNGDVLATEGEDYEWDTTDSNKLIIKANGLTVSGSTTKEYIEVASGVTGLTIKDLSMTVSGQRGINFKNAGATLTVIGDNTVTVDGTNIGIYFGGGTNKITGAGNLSVSAVNGNAIHSGSGKITLDCSGTITADSNAFGISSATDTVTVTANTGKVLVYGNDKDYGALSSFGLTVDPSLVMTGSATYQAAEKDITGEAAYVRDEWCVKTGGEVAKSVLIQATVPHDLSVTKSDGSTATEGTVDEHTTADYYWDGDVLHICSSGLKVTGETEKECIVIDEGVENIAFDGLKLVPKGSKTVENAISIRSSTLDVTLLNENVIGKEVTYNKDTTNGSDFVVGKGIVGKNGTNETICDLVFTGSGNLTIYDRYAGIEANSVKFDEHYTGKVTIRDYGENPRCCITGNVYVLIFGGTFDLTSYKSTGISVVNGDVTIKDASVTINAAQDGICSTTLVNIEDSTVSVTVASSDGNANGIVGENVNITDSTVNVSAASNGVIGEAYGIYAPGGTVTVAGSKSDVTVDAAAQNEAGAVSEAFFVNTLSVTGGKIKAKASGYPEDTYAFYALESIELSDVHNVTNANEDPDTSTTLTSKEDGYVVIEPGTLKYPVWVNGIRINEDNKSDVLGIADDNGGEKQTVVFTPAVEDDPKTPADESAPAILTLDGAELENIYVKETVSELKIRLVNTNTITNDSGDPAIYADSEGTCKLVFMGTGTLTVTDSSSHAIYTEGMVEFDGSCSVEANATGGDSFSGQGTTAIVGRAGVTIGTTGNITAKSTNGCAIGVDYGCFTVESGAGEIYLSGDFYDCGAVYAASNAIPESYEILGGTDREMLITNLLAAKFDAATECSAIMDDGSENAAKTFYIHKEVKCEYTETVKLTEGTFGMKLGGKDMGWFKFEAVDGGWKIMKTAKPGLLGTILNPYLAMKDGKLTYTDSDNATIWTYKNGAFSASTKTQQKTSGYWLLFWYIPGSTRTVTTTYYLSTVTDGQKLSTNTVKAELYTEASGAHEYGNWIDCKDGANHKRMCKHCGEWETEAHSYDPDTHKCVCGAYDPHEADVKISVDVKTKTTKQFSGFLFWGTWKNVTTYTATIKTEATGVKVTKVQYQLNGGRWTTGTSVSSQKPIKSLNVKAWDSNGNVHEYVWPEEEEETMTIADILPDNFPTENENAWVNGDIKCWKDPGDPGEQLEPAIVFGPLEGMTYAYKVTKSVTKDGNNWKYTNSSGATTLTFNMEGNVLKSINYYSTDSEKVALNGTYEPAYTCFVAGTQVQYDLDGSTKNIEDFEVGDTIVSYNVNTGEYYLAKVNRVFVHDGAQQTAQLVDMTLENGTVITMTANHPIFTQDGFKSVSGTSTLTAEDNVFVGGEWIDISDIQVYSCEPTTTYNIDVIDLDEIEDDNTLDTYIAGGAVVHNKPE